MSRRLPPDRLILRMPSNIREFVRDATAPVFHGHADAEIRRLQAPQLKAEISLWIFATKAVGTGGVSCVCEKSSRTRVRSIFSGRPDEDLRAMHSLGPARKSC